MNILANILAIGGLIALCVGCWEFPPAAWLGGGTVAVVAAVCLYTPGKRK